MKHQIAFSLRRVFFSVSLCLLLACLLLSGQVYQVNHAQTAALGAWTGAGKILSARYNHTATLLPNGKVLIAGGYLIIPPNSTTSAVPTTATELYDPETGQSSPSGNLNIARAEHSATLLPNGKVLVVSGGTAELYDPAADTWSRTGNLAIGGAGGHTATLLPNGKVLAVGGCRVNCATTSAELYDPAAGTWKTTTPMIASGRVNHTATLLSNGNLLVTGGRDIARSEIYNPTTDTWTETASLKQARYNHSAVRLHTGKVLLFGGLTLNINSYYVLTDSVELYDAVAGTWSASGNLNMARQGMTASLLVNDKLLICGGQSNVSLAGSSELYDPGNGLWTYTGDLNVPRSGHAAVTLSDGRVLIIGGRGDRNSLKSLEIFNPAQPSPPGYWMLHPQFGTNRYSHTTTVLPNGEMVLAGGTGEYGRLDSGYLFNYVLDKWVGAAKFRDARQYHTATLLPDGRVLITGGEGLSIKSLSSCELYYPLVHNNRWEVTAAMVTARRLHTATLLNNGRVLVVGGANDDIDLSSAEIFDPVTARWSGGGLLSSGRRQHTATLLSNGNVLVVGGSRNGLSLASTEIYDPNLGRWQTTASLKFARYGHTATLLNNGKVLVAGGADDALVADCEIFDPATEQWSNAGQLGQLRQNHTAVLLNDGRAIVIGGADSDGAISSVESFDPAANGGVGAWNRTASLKIPRESHTVNLLPNGKVYVFCGRNGAGVFRQSAEVFDPAGIPPVPFSPSAITVVSASTFRGGNLAPDSIAAVFGERLAAKLESGPDFGGTKIDVIDKSGQTRRAGLFFVSPTQINCQIPPGIAVGTAVLKLTVSSGISVTADINISPVVPGIFSADASGAGLAAAVVFRVRANGEQVYEPMVRFDATQNRFVAVPIDVSDLREQVFLILYGTGWRLRSRLSSVNVTIGGTSVETIYAGAQETFGGLDQLNVRLPGSLAGRGEVEIQVTADGIASNVVKANIK